MDELSFKLLSLLKADGRMSVTALSQALGVSRLTVDNRIKRLEAEDIISGYTVLLGTEEFKHKINGWIMINVAANKEERAIKLILRMVGNIQITYYKREVGFGCRNSNLNIRRV